MYSLDVLNTSLEDLLPKYTEQFLRGHPFLTYVMMSAVMRKVKLKGKYRTFNVVTNGPGQVTAMQTGSETLTSTRRNISAQGREDAARFIYHFGIPGKDLDDSGGPLDYGQILRDYPEVAVADCREIVTRQIMRGSASSGSDTAGDGVKGLLTLNGAQTYDPQGLGARTGLFQFSNTQTATVHGLPMADAASSPTTGWEHGYQHIGSFGVEGESAMRGLKTAADNNGKSLEGSGINLGLADFQTWQNYCDGLDARIIEVDKVNNPAAALTTREGVKFGKVDLYWEPEIDLTDTTSFSNANSQLGVLYLLNTAYWEFFSASNSGKNGDSIFFVQKPTGPLPDQDVYQWRIISYFNFFCRSLRHQALMTGGAVA